MGAKECILHMLVEFIGSVILAVGLNILRLSSLGFILLPFFCLGAYATAYRVTGAHLNPAVSLVNMIRTDHHEQFKSARLWPLLYILMQYAGHTVGVLLGYWFREDPGQLNIGRKPQGGDHWWYSEACGFEFFGSVMFVLIYLNQTSHISWLNSDPGLQCTLIAWAYGALVAWTSYRTGGSLNPAYGFGQNLWDQIDERTEDDFKFIWIYTIFPFIGGLFALLLHQFIVIPGHTEANNHIQVIGKAE